ncbi:hypothetical protein D5086_028451 [Populus alba]|uniref:Uncharacterized protein n=1 Tax=Populus alba TaxID=43335 RepID=A0ACC4AYN4_POPAL
MHPPLHDQPRYSGDVHQGPILVSGVPNPNPIHPYAPRMAMRHVRVVAGKWSTACFMSGAVYAFACFYSCYYWSKLRGQYDLEEDPCVDWLVHCCRDLCFVSRAQESWI